jgi:hypothetical protein
MRGHPWDLKRAMREVEESGAEYVQVSGGEPLLAPPLELVALLSWLKKNGKTVELQSNGATIPGYDDELLKRVAALTDVFNLNFSAHTAELDFEVTRTPGAFALREKAVDRLLALGAQVRLTYVIYARNAAEVESFPDYVAGRMPGISWIQFSFVKGMGRAKGSGAIVPKHSDAAPHLNRAMRRCGELGIRCEVDHIPVGYVPEFVNQHVDTHKVFHGIAGYHQKDKEQAECCVGCEFEASCPGVRKDYVEVQSGDLCEAGKVLLPSSAGRRRG